MYIKLVEVSFSDFEIFLFVSDSTSLSAVIFIHQ